MTSHTREMTAIIGGIERTLSVSFTVHSFGSPDSWDEPGDPAELEIEAIHDAETDRDLTDFCHSVRDLWGSPIKITNYGRNAWAPPNPMLDAILGERVSSVLGDFFAYHPPHLRLEVQSIAETIEQEIHENLHEYESSIADEMDWADAQD